MKRFLQWIDEKWMPRDVHGERHWIAFTLFAAVFLWIGWMVVQLILQRL